MNRKNKNGNLNATSDTMQKEEWKMIRKMIESESSCPKNEKNHRQVGLVIVARRGHTLRMKKGLDGNTSRKLSMNIATFGGVPSFSIWKTMTRELIP